MLVDIVPLYDTAEKRAAYPPAFLEAWNKLPEEHREMMIPSKIRDGFWAGSVHDIDDRNLDDSVRGSGNILLRYDDPRDGLQVMRDEGFLSQYGSCDGPDDLMNHPEYGPLLTGPRHFSVLMQELTSQSCPDWRWHKNGPYIGRGKPQREHLGNEPIIRRVFTFYIVEHRVELTPATS